jgi:hypothetical protein
VVAGQETVEATRRHPAGVGLTGGVIGLSWLIAALALPAAGFGLFWRGDGGAFAFTTMRGEIVELYGRGLYRYDTLFAAGGAQGNDAVVLLLGIPVLLATTALYRRGSIRWRLLHTGVLVYFLYMYASAALGTVVFNWMFPVYVVLLSASLFAVALSFASVDLRSLARQLSPLAPRYGLAVFLFASGVITLAAWGLPLVTALARGGTTDRLDSYSTEVTFALDLATITPLTFAAGALVLRGAALGYALAVSLLVLETALAPMIAAQTIGQLAAGVTFQPGEVIGPIGGFIALAAGAGWFIAAIARHVSREATP